MPGPATCKETPGSAASCKTLRLQAEIDRLKRAASSQPGRSAKRNPTVGAD
jgi:hypothetical protein